MATSQRQGPSESSDHWRTILTEKDWIKIRSLYDDGAWLSITMIAVRFGVSRELIWKGLKNNKGSIDQRASHHDKDIDRLRK